jgi:hypothetical protein
MSAHNVINKLPKQPPHHAKTESHAIHNNTHYVKIVHHDLLHLNFQYKIGLNEDIHPFNAIKYDAPGGFHFCDWHFKMVTLLWTWRFLLML